MTKIKKEIIELDLPSLGKVKIQELTVADVLASQALPEDKQVIFLVERCLLEPKMSEAEINQLPVRVLQDLAEIVENATGQK